MPGDIHPVRDVSHKDETQEEVMDRRRDNDRRQQEIEVAVERRKNIDRRSEHDRRIKHVEVDIDKR